MNNNARAGLACLITLIFSLGWMFGESTPNSLTAVLTTTFACLAWGAWQLSETMAKFILCWGLVAGVAASAVAGFVG